MLPLRSMAVRMGLSYGYTSGSRRELTLSASDEIFVFEGLSSWFESVLIYAPRPCPLPSTVPEQHSTRNASVRDCDISAHMLARNPENGMERMKQLPREFSSLSLWIPAGRGRGWEVRD